MIPGAALHIDIKTPYVACRECRESKVSPHDRGLIEDRWYQIYRIRIIMVLLYNYIFIYIRFHVFSNSFIIMISFAASELYCVELPLIRHVCICHVCVFSSHLFWTSSSLDEPAGVTQEEGQKGILIHLPFAVLALTFLARRIQPFLILVNREVKFCVLTMLSFSTCWAFFFFLSFFSEEKSQLTGSELTSQRVSKFRGYQLSYQGDNVCDILLYEEYVVRLVPFRMLFFYGDHELDLSNQLIM